jgi:hypothetical protein
MGNAIGRSWKTKSDFVHSTRRFSCSSCQYPNDMKEGKTNDIVLYVLNSSRSFTSVQIFSVPYLCTFDYRDLYNWPVTFFLDKSSTQYCCDNGNTFRSRRALFTFNGRYFLDIQVVRTKFWEQTNPYVKERGATRNQPRVSDDKATAEWNVLLLIHPRSTIRAYFLVSH